MQDNDYSDHETARHDALRVVAHYDTDNKGYGLAQWTTDDRKQGLQDILNGRSVDDLDAQLEYLKYELENNYSSVLDKLKNASSIHEASNTVLTEFEKPKNQSSTEDTERWMYSTDIANQLGHYDGEYYEEPEETPEETSEEEPEEKKDKEGIKDVDEFNVIDTSTTGGSSDNPFGFLEWLPLYTEFRMAEVYNIIDKWLGRIYKLFKSFKVDDFLKDLLDLKDLKLKLKGSLGIEDEK